jgi:DNA repair protein RecN (Recombination protein N)
MLRQLTISQIVLVDTLTLEFTAGFNILTGETGSGKSILLDALMFALGERARTDLIRAGQDQGSVTAAFELKPENPLWKTLEDAGLPSSGSELILRRTVHREGKSRAFINDTPVSATLLKSIAKDLVDIHGQFDEMLSSTSHRALLDRYAHITGPLASFKEYRHACQALAQAEETHKNRAVHEAFLQQALADFKSVNPLPHEEDQLLQARQKMQHHQKYLDALTQSNQALEDPSGAMDALHRAIKSLEKAVSLVPDTLTSPLEQLEKVVLDTEAVRQQLEKLLQDEQKAPHSLEELDDRLHALRVLARKHAVPVSELPALGERYQQEWAQLTSGQEPLEALRTELQRCKTRYREDATAFSHRRQIAAQSLSQAVTTILPDLKLDKAKVDVSLEPLGENDWNEHGIDRVSFKVQTNPGHPFGSFAKIASGGERSRITLAFKSILTTRAAIPVVVFDEVDSGVSGSVASAIGERLARMAQHQQVLVITHSPQVASFAHTHYRVFKEESAGQMGTRVIPLSPQGHREEIARMLADETLSPEALAAADRLIENARQTTERVAA